MASPLFKLLAELAEDPQKLAEFRRNPGRLMDEYGLSEEQKELILNQSEFDFIKAVMEETKNQFGSGRVGCI